ncbi:MAG TPA: alpha/beta hydrolase [Clostridia bacterium]|nr:alpha/beta hydrolase [Clostridia bacterium]
MLCTSEAPHRPFQPVPELQALLDLAKTLGNDLDHLTVENVAAVRAVREERARRFLWQIPLETVRNFTIPGDHCSVPVRLYVPQDKQLHRNGKLPLVIFFHGGGWTLGSPTIYDSITRQLARQIPALVLSVDYRLAPEHPFPAALQDTDSVLRWALQHAHEIGGDPTRIVLAGDSAGGNLATVTTLRARSYSNPPVAMQVLFYPSTNISSTDYASYQQYGIDHLLTKKAVESFRTFYLPRSSDWARPEASPLLAKDLSNLPPTVIIAAGCDPLRDEGYAYAQKLREHGTQVTYRLEPQLIHAFLNLYNLDPTNSPYAEGVLSYAAGVIREAMRVRGT